MKTLPHQILKHLILFVLFTLFQLPYITGNTLIDLTSNSYSSFTSEAANWGSTALNGATKVSSCWGYYILGGYNILSDGNGYFSKTFSGLATPHNTVYFTMKAFQIDGWDGGDAFDVYLNGYWINGWEFPRPSGWTSDACGGGWEEIQPVLIRATVPHTGSTFYVQVNSRFNQGSTDESFGFREITLTTDTTSSPSFYYCGVTAGNYLPYNWCFCTSHQYTPYVQSGICTECDVNCQTCSGSPTTCLTCYPGWFMVGTYCYPTCTYPLYSAVASSGITYCYTPCPGQYAYWDGTCGSACTYTNTYHNYPAIYAEIESTYPKCMYPCGTSQFLAWNNSCLAACPDPLVTNSYKSRNFCAYPCTATQYLAWNQSCLGSCPYPLSPETQGSNLPKQFCWYTCQPTQYLYFNQSCIDTCPYPLSPEVQGTFRQRNFCWYPCMPWQWLNWDQTCQESCVAPLWPEIVGNPLRQFCWYPCTFEARFLYWNTSCLPECPEPLSTRYENGQWFCDYPCSSTTQFLYWNGSCISTCNSPFLPKIEGNPARKYCYYPCPADQFVYWDNSCHSTCSFPLVPNFEGKFCWYLCPTNQFLYWNGTCSAQCDLPFVQRTTNNRQFCDKPCLSNEYLYWNASCKSTCLFPFVTQVQGTVLPINLCWYPCPSTQFLYWNGTCDNNCPYPLRQETQGSPEVRKFCHFPCQPTKYLYWNSSCLDTCPSPLTPETQGTRLFCWPTCESTKFLHWNGSCLDDCPAPLLPETQQPFKKFCWYPCKISQWVYWDQTCQDACPSPLLQEIQGTRQFCWYPCSTNQFLYWNGSCLTQCNLPLAQRTSNNQKFCDYPCKFYQYLYWNGSCLDSCLTPLSPRLEGPTPTIQYCDYLCPASQILYWDGACLSSCDSPLVLNTQGTPSRNFCWYLCSTSDYLYWNGTCLNQCNYPLSKKTFRGRNLCTYACTSQKYLAPNGSCVDNCPLEYFENVGLGFCQPCQDSFCHSCSSASFGTKCQQCKDPYILNSNGICQDCEALSSEFLQQVDSYTYQYKLTLSPASCDLDETTLRQSLLPTQNTKNQFPTFSYQINQTSDFNGEYFLLEIKFKQAVSSDSSLNFAIGSLKTGLHLPKTSDTTQSTADQEVKTTFAAVTGSTVGAGLTLGATAALWSIINFQQFISYFIYLNIKLPPHLLYFLTMFDNVNLEILPNPLASLTDRLAELWDSLVNNADPKYQLPNKFAEFNTPTLFVINAGSTFFVCLLLFILPYFFDFLRKYRDLGRQKFMVSIHSGLRWNIPIRIFLESGISLTFALFVQMRKISYSNVPYIISTIIASLAFIYLCVMINYIFQTLRDFKYEDLKDSRVEESIGTLFEGLLLKKEKPSGKYYYLFILFRGMLLVFMGVFVDHLPLVQTTVMALFNLFLVYYVCIVIEFQSRYLTWANRIKEVLILMVELLFMTLSSQSTTEEWRNLAGWVIICMLGVTLAMELLFGFYLQILAARDFVKMMRELVKRMRENCKKRKRRIDQEPPIVTEESSRNILTIET